MVVCRYREDVDWLRPYAAQTILYDKGGQEPPAVAPLLREYHAVPNIGRDFHAYLTFILDHYDALPDTVFFCQAMWSDHHLLAEHVRDACLHGAPIPPWTVAYNPSFTLAEWKGTLQQTGMTLDEFWTRMLPEVPPPADGTLTVWWGGFSVVPRDRIRRLPREVYARLRGTMDHSAPEAAHFLERMWYSMFYAPLTARTCEEQNVT